MEAEITNTGVIHGRFQVLHNDHLTYLLNGKRLCRHLVVGITNPDPGFTEQDNADLNRHTPSANPLTYFERHILVTAALKEAGINPDEFSVVPFPINTPALYHHYVPMDALFFLVIYDDWGRRKLEHFTSLGLKTHILREVPPEEKGISAGHVRKLMAQGKPWEQMVPPSVAQMLKKWRVDEQIRNI